MVFWALAQPLFGQNQNNHAFFGYWGGLNFATSPPTRIFDSPVVTNEGTAAISDRTTGQLLFYTDGLVVWDQNHDTMPNGRNLLGDGFSSTPAALIVPFPGDLNKYYVFTCAAQVGGMAWPPKFGGVAYSIIDMSLNGGLGDVTAVKNVTLLTSASEKLAGAMHCNGTDYWVLAHGWNDNTFYAYQVTDSGILPPITTSIGSVHADIGSGNRTEAIGMMNFSPDCKKFALINSYKSNSLEVFSFNNYSGVVTAQIYSESFSLGIAGEEGLYHPYGVCFSPDNSKLYASTHGWGAMPTEVFQYDVSIANQAAIGASKFTIASYNALTNSNWNTGMFLSPEGKIYISTRSNTFNIINNPNNAGAACNFVMDDFAFGFGPAPLFRNPNTNFTGPTFIYSNITGASAQPLLGNDIFTCDSIVSLNANVVADHYYWNTGDTTSTINVSITGDYWAQTTKGTCLFFDTIHVSIYNKPTFTLGPDIQTCDTVVLLNSPIVAQSYLWNNNSSNNSITATDGGQYILSVTNNSGCSYSDTVNIIFNPQPNISMPSTITSCNAAQLIATGAANNSYSWSNGQLGNNTFVAMTGTYYLTTVNQEGCSRIDSIVVTINKATPFSLGIDTSTCKTNLQLNTPFVAAAYWWSTGESSQSITVTSSGVYSLQITDQNGCTIADSIQVDIYSPPSIYLGNDIVSCNDTIVINGPSGYSYQWNSGEQTQQLIVTNSGTYALEINNGNCKNSDTIQVTLNSSTPFTLGNDVTVCDTNYSLLGPNTNSYLWNTGETSQSILVQNTGVYVLQTTDLGGCTSIDSVNIILFKPAKLNLGPDITLCDSNYLLTAPTANSYLWSTGNTTQVLPINTSGIYTLEINDINGCSAVDSVTITLHQATSFSLGADTSMCANSFLIAGPSANNYLWSNGSTTQNTTVNTSGEYSLTTTDVNGCTYSDKRVVTLNSSTPFSLGSDIVSCKSSDTINAPSNYVQYNWSNGSTAQTTIIQASGTYILNTLDANNCSASDTINVTLNTTTKISLGNDTSLCDSTFILFSPTIASNYLWNTGDNNSSISINTTGQYSLQITDANGCTAIDTISINFYDPVILNLGNDTSLCRSSLAINAPNSFSTYSWGTGETTSSITVLNSGNYTLHTTDFNGCKQQDEINISLNTPTTFYLGPDVSVCDQNYLIQTPGTLLLNWEDGSSASSYLVQQSGNYIATYINAQGCKSSDTINVVINTKPFVDAGSDITINRGEDILLNATASSGQYTWTPSTSLSCGNCINPLASPINTTTYILTITDLNGCSNADTVILHVFPEADQICTDYFVPSAFSPNEDGSNDVFIVRGGCFLEFELNVYNRLGERVFVTTDPKQGWDGAYNQKKLDAGVFVFYLRGVSYKGEEIFKQGNVTLVD